MFCGCLSGDAGHRPPLMLSVQKNKLLKYSCVVQACDHLAIVMMSSTLEAYLWMSPGRGWMIKAMLPGGAGQEWETLRLFPGTKGGRELKGFRVT